MPWINVLRKRRMLIACMRVLVSIAHAKQDNRSSWKSSSQTTLMKQRCLWTTTGEKKVGTCTVTWSVVALRTSDGRNSRVALVDRSLQARPRHALTSPSSTLRNDKGNKVAFARKIHIFCMFWNVFPHFYAQEQIDHVDHPSLIRSFVKSDMSNLLRSLIKKEQGWEFAHQFSQQIACYLQKNERIAHLLKKHTRNLLIRSYLVSYLRE